MAKFVLDFDSKNCKGCGLCVAYCPKHLLVIDNDAVNAKGYRTAKITDMDACVGCKSCITMCPDSIITMSKN